MNACDPTVAPNNEYQPTFGFVQLHYLFTWLVSVSLEGLQHYWSTILFPANLLPQSPTPQRRSDWLVFTVITAGIRFRGGCRRNVDYITCRRPSEWHVQGGREMLNRWCVICIRVKGFVTLWIRLCCRVCVQIQVSVPFGLYMYSFLPFFLCLSLSFFSCGDV